MCDGIRTTGIFTRNTRFTFGVTDRNWTDTMSIPSRHEFIAAVVRKTYVEGECSDTNTPQGKTRCPLAAKLVGEGQKQRMRIEQRATHFVSDFESSSGMVGDSRHGVKSVVECAGRNRAGRAVREPVAEFGKWALAAKQDRHQESLHLRISVFLTTTTTTLRSIHTNLLSLFLQNKNLYKTP